MHLARFPVGRIAACLIVAGAALVGANSTQAQIKYPDHPIRLIVPFPPAGRPIS